MLNIPTVSFKKFVWETIMHFFIKKNMGPFVYEITEGDFYPSVHSSEASKDYMFMLKGVDYGDVKLHNILDRTHRI